MWCMWHLNYGTLLEYYCDVTLRYILLQGMEIHLKIICRIKGFFWKNVGGSLKTCTIQPQGNREIQKLLSISFSRASSSLTSVSFRTSAQFSSADCLPLLFVCLFVFNHPWISDFTGPPHFGLRKFWEICTLNNDFDSISLLHLIFYFWILK